MSAIPPTTRVWRRLVSARQTDAWLERLIWLGSERIVTIELPGKKRARLEVYDCTVGETRTLTQQYGGEVRTVRRTEGRVTAKRTFVLGVPPHCCVMEPDSPVPSRWAKLTPIYLPAGMAFGTGEHATTAMCLRQMLSLCGRGGRDLKKSGTEKSVLDVGTGSGLLALAAAAAGHRVVALDNDPEAVREAKKNATLNKHVPAVDWRHGTVQELGKRETFDLIVANLYLAVHLSSLSNFKKAMKPGGHLILSGILHEQESEALALLLGHAMLLKRRLRKGKWLCLVATSEQ
ncbi:MAG: 50S ribosomal protein L11 methyltransferase [Candidatus Methylacidiphilales bacterium]